MGSGELHLTRLFSRTPGPAQKLPAQYLPILLAWLDAKKWS